MLTEDQISQLAPDAASLKAARGQSALRQWQGAGRKGQALWGAIQGSGKDPYRTVIDLSGPAFQCSCPSRKLPCKHGLGLLLMAAQNPVAEVEPADWAREWLDKRGAKAEVKQVKQAEEASPEAQAQREAASAKRAQKRLVTMTEGIAQTQQWLEDLIGQGMAWAQSQPAKYWADQTTRLNNAQSTGVARLVDECFVAAKSGEGWQPRLLAALGRVYWFTRAWAAREQLDERAQASLQAMAGIPTPQEPVLAQAGISGSWQVLARVEEDDVQIRTARHWLWHHDTGRLQVVLHFAAGKQAMDTSLPPGLVLHAEVVPYGDASFRALIKSREVLQTPTMILSDSSTPAEALHRARMLWVSQPWLEQVPIAFTAKVAPTEGGFVGTDGGFLAWEAGFKNAWLLAAMAGGVALRVFGELTHDGFRPLFAATADGMIWHQHYLAE